MRNVALFASQRSGHDFNKYWPAAGKKSVDTITVSAEMLNKIREAHKLPIK